MHSPGVSGGGTLGGHLRWVHQLTQQEAAILNQPGGCPSRHLASWGLLPWTIGPAADFLLPNLTHVNARDSVVASNLSPPVHFGVCGDGL